MQNVVRTPNRLTVMLPVVKAKPSAMKLRVRLENFYNDPDGRKLVTDIFIRKGMKLLTGKNGKFKPTANLIMAKNMVRLRNNEDPRDIIRDMQSQLLLM